MGVVVAAAAMAVEDDAVAYLIHILYLPRAGSSKGQAPSEIDKIHAGRVAAFDNLVLRSA